MDPAVSTPWFRLFSPKLGLKGKVTVGLVAVLMVTMFITGGVTYHYWENMAERAALNEAFDGVDHEVEHMQMLLDESKVALRIIENTPPIQAIIRTRDAGGVDPISGDKLMFWTKRMADIFKSFLWQMPHIVEFSYLDENGNELVRVNTRDNQATQRVEEGDLENKAESDCFVNGMQLAAGKIYMSGMSLERQQKSHKAAYPSMLCMAEPVFDAAGHRRGVIALRITPTHLFANLHAQGDNLAYYVVNHDGAFLYRPDNHKASSFAAGFEHTLHNDFPELAAKTLKQDEDVDHYAEIGKVEAFRKLFFDEGNDQRYIMVISVIPDEVVFASVYTTPKCQDTFF